MLFAETRLKCHFLSAIIHQIGSKNVLIYLDHEWDCSVRHNEWAIMTETSYPMRIPSTNSIEMTKALERELLFLFAWENRMKIRGIISRKLLKST